MADKTDADGAGKNRVPGEKGAGRLARRGAMAVVAAAGLAVARRLHALDLHLVRSAVPGGRTSLVYTTRDGDGAAIRVMRTGGVYQSATYLEPARRMEPVFAYYRAFFRAFGFVPSARAVLAIGGGGFAFPKLVAADRPGTEVDVVEIDPAIISAARRWFFLDDASELARAGGGELRVICDDGRSYLRRGCDGRRYDVIVVDAFNGAEPVRDLATVEAAREARSCLGPEGVLLANVVSRGGGRDVGFLRAVVASYGEAFSHVWVLLATDEIHAGEDNYLVVASDAALDVSDAIPYDADFLVPALHDRDADSVVVLQKT